MYDAGCGPCTRFKRFVEFFDSFHRFNFLSLIEADNEGLLDMVPERQRHRSFHLISPEGIASSGAKAIPTLVSLLPSGTVLSKLIESVPGGFRAIEFVYGVMSRLHDTGSCQYKPGQGQARSKKMELLDNRFGFISNQRQVPGRGVLPLHRSP